MKMPKGWPTGAMCSAFELEAITDITISDFAAGLEAALAVAPTPPEWEAGPVYQAYHDGAWEDLEKSKFDWCQKHNITTRILYTCPATKES